MRTEEEIKERIKYANKQAEECYKCGNFMDMERWYSYASGIEWVLEEQENEMD